VLETTEGWSNYWLNDRELARRPWVHNPEADDVDKMLAAVPKVAAKLKFRLFAEPMRSTRRATFDTVRTVGSGVAR